MLSFFRRLFSPGAKSAPKLQETAFAARFHRFRLFLSAYLDAYSEMMSFEERLASAEPLGMPFLRSCTARLTIASMQCVLQLNALGDNRFSRLNEPFSRLREDIRASLAQGTLPVEGPLVIPFGELGEEHSPLVSPTLVKIRAVRQAHPEFVPKGFVVTAATWWRYYNDPDMHDEIDRIMIISQEDPGSYGEASATIRERITSSFPLPAEVEEAISRMLEGYPELETPGNAVLVRCLPVLPEHAALVVPEQVLYAPVDARTLLNSVRYALAMTYRPRAILYRLKRGIRDRAMPLCVSVALLPEVHGRGSAHRKLETLNPDELFLHVRRGFSAPDTAGQHATDEKASLPDEVQTRLEEGLRIALGSLADAPVRGNRHEIFWAASEQGRLYVLGVNALPDPVREDARPAEHILAQENCLRGGLSTYPGEVCGPVVAVRNFMDALHFPVGHVLIVDKAIPRWTFLLDFASAAVAGDGTGNGLFAHTARRYGRPTILRQPDAFASFSSGDEVYLHASVDHGSCICKVEGECLAVQSAPPADGVPGAAYPLPEKGGVAPPVWLPSSSLAEIARSLAPKIVPLTLPDADHVDFRAENCKTFHDIIEYCHVHAVREMFRAGTSRKSASTPAKQLVCDVPKQFWIINLDDGFYADVPGPVVKLEEIASLPMRALWEGFTDKPWEGPPQLNAKGFLSVLFEASANPNLDPASQSTQYVEKNVFLIAKRFCSMRCRFGFHLLSLDCLLGERVKERFIIFQFKGGAANLARRIRRVHFVAELLSQFEFATEVVGDILTARLENTDERVFLSSMRILGYITMHTRQLDMIMGDEQALAEHRGRMLADMSALAARGPLDKPGPDMP